MFVQVSSRVYRKIRISFCLFDMLKDWVESSLANQPLFLANADVEKIYFYHSPNFFCILDKYAVNSTNADNIGSCAFKSTIT